MIRESKIEDYLVRRVKKEGGEIRKVSWIGRNNAPDRFVLFPGTAAFVELKGLGKYPTAAQKREITRLRKAGIQALAINSFSGVEYLITIMLAKSKK